MKTKILSLLDGPALIVAMVVDMILVGLGLWIIGPGLLEKIALCLLGVVAVLFAVRAWLKGGPLGVILWGIFALSVFFLDLSFMMAATDPALDVPDTELTRLESEAAKADAAVDTLRADYRAAKTRATMDQLDGQIEAAQAVADSYRAEYRGRWIAAQWGRVTSVKSAALSVSIYTAATSGQPGRITFLVIFGLLFAGLQITMITAASETKKQATASEVVASHPSAPPRRHLREKTDLVVGKVEDQPERHQAPALRPRIADPVARWVGVEWNYIQNGRGVRPLTKESFYKATKKSPDQMSPEVWDSIHAAACRAGVIVDGVITEPDKAKTAERIREAMKMPIKEVIG